MITLFCQMNVVLEKTARHYNFNICIDLHVLLHCLRNHETNNIRNDEISMKIDRIHRTISHDFITLLRFNIRFWFHFHLRLVNPHDHNITLVLFGAWTFVEHRRKALIQASPNSVVSYYCPLYLFFQVKYLQHWHSDVNAINTDRYCAWVEISL